MIYFHPGYAGEILVEVRDEYFSRKSVSLFAVEPPREIFRKEPEEDSDEHLRNVEAKNRERTRKLGALSM